MENNTTNQNICDTTLAQNDEKINNVIEMALAKIEEESKDVSGQEVPAIAIYNYVKEKIKSSEEYAKLVLIKTKSLDKCFTHIMKIYYERAKTRPPMAINGVTVRGIGTGSEIFKHVDDYFKLDDEAIAAKEKAEKEAAETAKKKAAEERKAKAKTEKKTETDKQVKEKSADMDNQISLF